MMFGLGTADIPANSIVMF